MSDGELATTEKAFPSQEDIHFHLRQLHDAVDAIVRITQHSEKRLQHEWDLLHQERERMHRDLAVLHARYTPNPPVPFSSAHLTATPDPTPPVKSVGLWSDVLDADASGATCPPRITSTMARAQLRLAPAVERSFWIHIWPCFGTFAAAAVTRPLRVVVHGGYRFMEQLTERAGEAAGCKPAPSVLYEPDGRRVTALAELRPEQHYLLFPSGGFYRREAVPAALLEELVRTAKRTIAQHDTHRSASPFT